jgi:hypothetical protein
VTTNVPGPRIPLYVLGKRMVTATAYVPIAGGTRCSIGIFSYLNTMTFGINADFDAYPDVDLLSGGIRKGIEELLELAAKEKASAEKGATDKGATDKRSTDTASAKSEPTTAKTPARRRTAATGSAAKPAAKKAAPKKSTAAAGQ